MWKGVVSPDQSLRMFRRIRLPEYFQSFSTGIQSLHVIGRVHLSATNRNAVHSSMWMPVILGKPLFGMLGRRTLGSRPCWRESGWFRIVGMQHDGDARALLWQCPKCKAEDAWQLATMFNGDVSPKLATSIVLMLNERKNKQQHNAVAISIAPFGSSKFWECFLNSGEGQPHDHCQCAWLPKEGRRLKRRLLRL